MVKNGEEIVLSHVTLLGQKYQLFKLKKPFVSCF